MWPVSTKLWSVVLSLEKIVLKFRNMLLLGLFLHWQTCPRTLSIWTDQSGLPCLVKFPVKNQNNSLLIRFLCWKVFLKYKKRKLTIRLENSLSNHQLVNLGAHYWCLGIYPPSTNQHLSDIYQTVRTNGLLLGRSWLRTDQGDQGWPGRAHRFRPRMYTFWEVYKVWIP